MALFNGGLILRAHWHCSERGCAVSGENALFYAAERRQRPILPAKLKPNGAPRLTAQAGRPGWTSRRQKTALIFRQALNGVKISQKSASEAAVRGQN
ncbi:hypothetical protein ACWXWB_15810 [Pantoea dispersa]|uniref:hypothetical protein n=1 Tax=Pantoea dispersa TaxID=59814 RepID=UPI002DB90CD3|nr:hypothetical protein [Pantoea dispersa]MEB5974075.1 hypothetical protein [Pantoea dispersa]